MNPVSLSAPTSLRFSIRDDLVLFVNRDQTPGDSEWDEYCDALEAAARTHSCVRILVVTEGGSPSPVQRRRVAALSERRKNRSAVVTDSILARAVVTAFGWLKLEMKAFSSSRVVEAYDYLELSSAEREWATETMASLQAELRSPAIRVDSR